MNSDLLTTDLREALVIRPGDVLIVRYADRSISLDQLKSTRDALMQRLPGLCDVLIMAADEIAVFRPEVAA